MRRWLSRAAGSLDSAEVNKFSRLASSWWRQGGPMEGLHRMNPVRVNYILSCLKDRSGSGQPLDGYRILDVGCGAGILSETLARLGARVTGLDASADSINAAKEHAARDPLLQNNLHYRHGTVEELPVDEPFDVVTALEVIEHVNNPKDFVKNTSNVLKEGGDLFISTINRNLKSYLLAVIAAEYVLRMVPIGTHDWNKFLTLDELDGFTREAGLVQKDQAGMVCNPITFQWAISRTDLDVNFIVNFQKPLLSNDN